MQYSHVLALGGVVVVSLAALLVIQRAYSDPTAGANSKKKRIRRSMPLDSKSFHTVEFCVSDVESAIAAIRGGATSLELCSNRLEGGITPSIGFVEEVVRFCRNLAVEVHVLIRPRPGGFVYTIEEFETMLRDVSAVVALGVDGVVCGVLTADFKVDLVRMLAVRKLCKDVQLTFHRAFDLCSGCLDDAMQSILSLGCERLLTSGQHPTAVEGVDVLKELENKYGHRLKIVAAAGLKAGNVADLIQRSRVRGIHVGSGVDVLHTTLPPSVEDGSSSLVFEDMMRWKGASQEMVEELMDACIPAWNSLAM